MTTTPRRLSRSAPVALAAAAIALAPAVAPVRAEGRASYGGALIGSLTSEPATLDPTRARSHAELTLAGLLFDGLYALDGGGVPTPRLAQALPELDRAGTTARIEVRADVLFHDGAALTVADVVASLRRTRLAGGLPGVVAIDERAGKVEVTLATADADLALLLATPAAAITPGGKAPSASAAVGTGPFALAAVERGARRVKLVAFDEHVRGRPFLDSVQLDWFGDGAAEARRYEAGGAHVASRGASVFAGHTPRYATVEIESAATTLTYLGVGKAHPKVTGAADFRLALSAALVRAGLTGTGMGERVVPTDGPVPADLGGVAMPAAAAAGKLDVAQKLLAKAAATVADLAEGARAKLSLSILVDATRLDDREVAERAARALDKLGLAARVEAVGAADFATKVASGACDLYVGQLGLPAPSGRLAWWLAFEAGGSSWARDRLAKGSFDERAAAAAFAGALPIIPVAHRAVRYQLRTDLRGARADVAGRLSLPDVFLHGRPRKAS
jgi:peptide/nickel transport system substrate-binding protein